MGLFWMELVLEENNFKWGCFWENDVVKFDFQAMIFHRRIINGGIEFLEELIFG